MAIKALTILLMNYVEQCGYVDASVSFYQVRISSSV